MLRPNDLPETPEWSLPARCSCGCPTSCDGCYLLPMPRLWEGDDS